MSYINEINAYITRTPGKKLIIVGGVHTTPNPRDFQEMVGKCLGIVTVVKGNLPECHLYTEMDRAISQTFIESRQDVLEGQLLRFCSALMPLSLEFSRVTYPERIASRSLKDKFLVGTDDKFTVDILDCFKRGESLLVEIGLLHLPFIKRELRLRGGPEALFLNCCSAQDTLETKQALLTDPQFSGLFPTSEPEFSTEGKFAPFETPYLDEGALERFGTCQTLWSFLASSFRIVPVTGQPDAGSLTTSTPSVEEVPINSMSAKQLKAACVKRGINTKGLSEKNEYKKALTDFNASAASAASAAAGGGAGGGGGKRKNRRKTKRKSNK
jgi:hypothetical protein